MNNKEQNGSSSQGVNMPKISLKEVRERLKQDVQVLYGLLDLIWKDPVVFDAVAEAMFKRYENLREQIALDKQGKLFKDLVDEQTE